MQAFRKPSALAPRLHGSLDAVHQEQQSPEQSATASSGTYRAVRPTPAEAAALARGEAVLDLAKLEGLRFELDVGIWRCHAEHVAGRLVDDADCCGGTDDE
jgi:hypothetical protein